MCQSDVSTDKPLPEIYSPFEWCESTILRLTHLNITVAILGQYGHRKSYILTLPGPITPTKFFFRFFCGTIPLSAFPSSVAVTRHASSVWSLLSNAPPVWAAMDSRMNSMVCSRATGEYQQSSRISTPSVMLGRSRGSALIFSMVFSVASSRWMPYCSQILPHVRSPLLARRCSGCSCMANWKINTLNQRLATELCFIIGKKLDGLTGRLGVVNTRHIDVSNLENCLLIHWIVTENPAVWWIAVTTGLITI